MGIFIKRDATESYLYLCGIKPVRSINIGDGIILMPAIPHPDPEDMIDSIMKSDHANELELGVLIATLRCTTAQIKVTGNNEKEIAIKTWNAQQICVQLSAILDCDLSWYFQANVPIEDFGAKTDVHLIMPNMYKMPTGYIEVTSDKCDYLEKQIDKACHLSDCNDKYDLATSAMWCSRLTFRTAIRLSVIWSGIETLFRVDNHIKETISKAGSRFLLGNDDMCDDIKYLYKEARCKAIHEYSNSTDLLLQKSNKLLHDLILKSIEIGDTPNVKKLMSMC